MKTLISLLSLIVILTFSCTKEEVQPELFTVISATAQSWAGGQEESGTGINYIIEVNKDVEFTSITINDIDYDLVIRNTSTISTNIYTLTKTVTGNSIPATTAKLNYKNGSKDIEFTVLPKARYN